MDRFDWLELEEAGKGHEGAKAAPRTRPHDAPTFFKAAREMREAGHFRAACDFYHRALAMDDHHYAAWMELVDTLVRARQHEAADKASYEALSNYRQVRGLYAARALALLHMKRDEEALPLLQIALEGKSDTWYASCIQAEALLRQTPENREEALWFLKQAIEACGEPWEAFFLGGWMLLDAKLPVIAAGYFAETAHYRPHSAIAWLCLGDCFRELRLYDQARFYYQRVSEIEPSNELALERQKACGSLIYGLMRIFRREDLQGRWNKEFDRLFRKD